MTEGRPAGSTTKVQYRSRSPSGISRKSPWKFVNYLPPRLATAVGGIERLGNLMLTSWKLRNVRSVGAAAAILVPLGLMLTVGAVWAEQQCLPANQTRP